MSDQYDNCFADGPNTGVSYNPSYDLRPHFAAMRDALQATGRPILFSVCEWGVQDPARWPGTSYGNSWRMSYVPPFTLDTKVGHVLISNSVTISTPTGTQSFVL